jgi:hypothetical protein
VKLLFNILPLALILTSLYSCRRKNELPIHEHFVPTARQDPVQTPAEQSPFTVQINEEIHTVTPLFDYAIAGMVVSSGFSKTLAEHRKDSLNILDVGLIWGDNLDTDLYRKLEFYNDGVWLHARTEDGAAWERLNPLQLSNNHLLSNDPDRIRLIRTVKRGDVIQIKGWLVNYSGRGSSVNRTDTGDGACETIWVEDFTILQEANRLWHLAFYSGLYGAAALLFVRILLFFVKTPTGFRAKEQG